MKKLKVILEHAEIRTESLRALFEQDGATTFAMTVKGDDALGLWRLCRDLIPKTGRWPLLVGAPGHEEMPTNRKVWTDKAEVLKTYPPTSEILEKAKKIDFAAILAREHLSSVESAREGLAGAEECGDADDIAHYRELLDQPEEFQGLPREDWPEEADPYDSEFIAGSMRFKRGGGEKDVTVALLPTPHAREVPAVMKWGGWNANPSSAEHVAALRFWHERYGAELVAMTHDVLEFIVERPPETREEALRLAKWQYFYCGDSISQGEGSLDALAAKLLDADAWYFWWD